MRQFTTDLCTQMVSEKYATYDCCVCNFSLESVCTVVKCSLGCERARVNMLISV